MGSDLKKRTLFGALFLIVMVAGLMFQYTCFFLMIAILLSGVGEFCKMTLGEDRLTVQECLAKIAGITLLCTTMFYCNGSLDRKWMALTIIPVIFIPVSFIFTGSITRTDKLAPIYTALVYIALPVALSPFLMFRDGEFSGKLLLSCFILIWMSDTGAYCIGSLLGQNPTSRKLAPSLSPKKSWWGFWGSIFAGALTGMVLHLCNMLEFPMAHCIALGVIVAALCVCGDLVESMWKRRCNVKDSGNVIPGHGGILDRFDSSLTAIPAVAIYLLIFGLI